MVSAMQDRSLSLAPNSADSQTDLAVRDQAFHAFVDILPNAEISSHKGPLSGLTFAAKDMFVYRDRQPTCGLEIPPALGLSGTARVVEILIEAGAVLSGFTTLTALAYEPSGVNGNGSRPVNPWGANLITGGSSSGSAVAVAAGLVDFAIGSDTAGSLRIPAQACGVASYKPSYGLISVAGAMPLAPSLDCIGFLARDVGLLQTVAQHFVAPSSQLPLQLYIASDLTEVCATEIAAQLQTVQKILNSDGVETKPIALAALIKAADAPLFVLLEGETAQSFTTLLQNNALPEKLAQRIGKGLRHSQTAMQNARAAASTLHDQWLAHLPPDSCVILPAMPCLTPDVELCTQGSDRFSAKALYALSELTRLGSLLGLPVVTVPVGLDRRGAPLAVQMMGHRGQDQALLAAAMKIQGLSGFDLYDTGKTEGHA
jgi:Asp-tRNA(Asn)/Glu-tRNA(Gln) amidotransferase A subunit family amidase